MQFPACFAALMRWCLSLHPYHFSLSPHHREIGDKQRLQHVSPSPPSSPSPSPSLSLPPTLPISLSHPVSSASKLDRAEGGAGGGRGWSSGGGRGCLSRGRGGGGEGPAGRQVRCIWWRSVPRRGWGRSRGCGRDAGVWRGRVARERRCGDGGSGKRWARLRNGQNDGRARFGSGEEGAERERWTGCGCD